jgi:hypothetical protein
LKVLIQRHSMLNAWENWLRAPERWGRVIGSSYRVTNESLRREIERRGAPRVPLRHDVNWKELHESAMASLEYLPEGDAEVVRAHWIVLSYLRIAQAALGALARRVERASLDPPRLDATDEIYRDPFGDGPLHSASETDPPGWRIYSVGPDGRDDGGRVSTDDVVLRFRAPKAVAPP